ncbi:PadR family transcriptional regulator [Clostridium sp. UBA1652]|uniref:PadR family transcriptional regulator n=1 Tax=Clostridium sp. UBA1652 TaxID=1946348 RepID=UPI0032E499B0
MTEYIPLEHNNIVKYCYLKKGIEAIMISLENAIKIYIPMTETMYYILLSLVEEKHGYGIMQHIEEITNKRLTLGAGTIYKSISRLEIDGLIKSVKVEDRRKIYKTTELGREILEMEVKRLNELNRNGILLLERSK